MNDVPRRRASKRKEPLANEIAAKTERKLRARREETPSIYFGLGMFGLVGWSVAIPTVLGIAIGIWIDTTWPSRFSWTLICLVIGAALGCLNAWHWMKREGRKVGTPLKKQKKSW